MLEPPPTAQAPFHLSPSSVAITAVEDMLTISEMVQALYTWTPPSAMSSPLSMMDMFEDSPASSRAYTCDLTLSSELSLMQAYPWLLRRLPPNGVTAWEEWLTEALAEGIPASELEYLIKTFMSPIMPSEKKTRHIHLKILHKVRYSARTI